MKFSTLNNNQIYTPVKPNQRKVSFFSKTSNTITDKKLSNNILISNPTSDFSIEKFTPSIHTNTTSNEPEPSQIKAPHSRNMSQNLSLNTNTIRDLKTEEKRNPNKLVVSFHSIKFPPENKMLKSQRSISELLDYNRNSSPLYYRKEDKETMSSLIRDKSLNSLLNNLSSTKKKSNESNEYFTPEKTNTKDDNHKKSFSASSDFSNLNNSLLTVSSTLSRVSVNIFPINLQEVITVQEKIKLILLKLSKVQPPFNECIEWWNCFYSGSFMKNCIDLFSVEKNKMQMIMFFNIESLCFLLCIDLCTNSEAFTRVSILLKSIFSFIHFDFLLMAKFILVKYNNNDLLTEKLYNLIKYELSDNLGLKEVNEYLINELIKHNIKQIMVYYEKIIDMFYIHNKKISITSQNIMNNNSISDRKYDNISPNEQNQDFTSRSSISTFLVDSFYNLNSFSAETYDGILKYFKENYVQLKNNYTVVRATANEVQKTQNMTKNYTRKHIATKSLHLNTQNRQMIIHKIINPKYLLPDISPNYTHTLVLDLENTLLYVKFEKDGNFGKAKLIFRPLLFEFLKKMKNLFEIVLFTLNTKEYITPIINEIEKNEVFFVYKLFKEGADKVNGDYVKDLSKLGRDLRKTIIVDNIENNFKLQKRNGICIKAFCGDRQGDGSILSKLGSILERIRFDETEDIRDSIEKFKNYLMKIAN